MGIDDFDFDEDLFGGDEEEEGFDFEEEGEFEDFDEFEDLGEDLEGGLFEEEEEFEDIGDLGVPGPSRTFVMMAFGMIIVFVAAIALIALLILTKEEELSDFDLTSTQIAIENAGTMAAYNATLTQQPLDLTETAVQEELLRQAELTAELTMTAEAVETQQALTAEAIGLTETAEYLMTPEEATPTPGVDELGALQTQQALTRTAEAEATLTAQAPPEATPEVRTPVGAPDVALTATEIARILLGTPLGATPTQEAIGGPETPVATPFMPDTGLFGDSVSDAEFGLMILIAFGLVGMIFGARTLRAANSRKR